MLKDERDDMMQEDESLEDMIHQYNEESELRRKINEMKKQKSDSMNSDANQESNTFVPKNDTNAYVGNAYEDEEEFIDEDKTLVIMDSKTKASFGKAQPTRQDVFEEKPYAKPETKHTKASASKVSEEVEDEKTRKLNKIITIIIVSILSIVLLCGIGYGLYAIISNNAQDDAQEVEPQEDPTPSVQEPTTPPVENNEPDEDITDNRAEISRLEKQHAVYEEQIKSIENQINEKVAEIQNLEQEVNDAKARETAMNDALKNMNDLKLTMDAIQDKESQEYKTAQQQYNDAKSKYDLAKQEFDVNGGLVDNTKKVEELQADIAELNAKIPDLQLEMSKIETDLYNLKK